MFLIVVFAGLYNVGFHSVLIGLRESAANLSLCVYVMHRASLLHSIVYILQGLYDSILAVYCAYTDQYNNGKSELE